MSALADFYKKAKADPAIVADLKAAKEGLGSAPSKDAIFSAVIGVAKKHGVTLAQADFKLQGDSIDDEELRSVAGGCGENTYGCRHYDMWTAPTWPGEPKYTC